MKNTLLKTSITLGITLLVLSFKQLPNDWHVGGNQAKDYIANMEIGTNQEKIMTLKSNESEIKGFGCLTRKILPQKMLGKRIRMVGYLKTKDVKSWASFWLRVGKKGDKYPLAFDNMGKRPIKGTTDWKKYVIVLDVPKNATEIAYGAQLDGTGQIWFKDIKFQEVNDLHKITGSEVHQ